MKIALFHNEYTIRGGEERTVEFQAHGLTRAGHQVLRYDVRNRDVFDKPAAGIGAALRASWNRKSYKQVLDFLHKHRPDVSHVHNWFPLLSPSIHAAHADLGIPLVQSLHNYRMRCAAGTLMREGKRCTLCLDGDTRPAVENRCYRNSKVQTAVWARTMEKGWSSGAFTQTVDAYVAPSRVVAETHERMGLPADRIHVIHHGSEDPLEHYDWAKEAMASQGKGGVFVGRLVAEKGLDTLLEAWEGIDAPLTVVGTGPEEYRLRERAAAMPQVTMLGELPRTDVLRMMTQAAFLVFPSVWEEPFGLGVVEAMACSRPVIGSRIGAIPEMIYDGVNGRLVQPGDAAELRAAIGQLVSRPEACRQLGASARRVYEDHFRPGNNLHALVTLYEKLQTDAMALAG